MTNQQLAANYANSIADELWALDSSGDIFPHICEQDEAEREELSCEADPICMEQLGAHGYLADVLDIEYRVSHEREYRSARVMIAYGGPTAWIDTRTRQLEVYWDERIFVDIPEQFCTELDEYLEELFHC